MHSHHTIISWDRCKAYYFAIYVPVLAYNSLKYCQFIFLEHFKISVKVHALYNDEDVKPLNNNTHINVLLYRGKSDKVICGTIEIIGILPRIVGKGEIGPDFPVVSPPSISQCLYWASVRCTPCGWFTVHYSNPSFMNHNLWHILVCWTLLL